MPRTKWIQRALKGRKPGALHRQLGVPVGKKIPLPLLRQAARAPETLKKSKAAAQKLGRRARLALTLRGFSRRKRT